MEKRYASLRIHTKEYQIHRKCIDKIHPSLALLKRLSETMKHKAKCRIFFLDSNAPLDEKHIVFLSLCSRALRG